MNQTPPVVQQKKRKKWPWILGAVLVFGTCVALFPEVEEEGASNGAVETTVEPATAPAEPAPRPAPDWHEVTRWTGNGIKDTETFQVQSREWRITWETSGAGYFGIYVHDGETDDLVTVAANTTEGGSDTSYLRSGPGPHYLTINASTNWTVVVEDRR